jgi:hypothetical protein
MISSTLGAPWGGTTRGGHQGLDCRALFLITPPNFGSGAGSCLPLIVMVASGEPGVPAICWDMAGETTDTIPIKSTVIEIVNGLLQLFISSSFQR